MIVPPNNFYQSGFTGGDLLKAQVSLTCKPCEGVLFPWGESPLQKIHNIASKGRPKTNSGSRPAAAQNQFNEKSILLLQYLQ
jgi:hypothetical protein